MAVPAARDHCLEGRGPPTGTPGAVSPPCGGPLVTAAPQARNGLRSLCPGRGPSSLYARHEALACPGTPGGDPRRSGAPCWGTPGNCSSASSQRSLSLLC